MTVNNPTKHIDRRIVRTRRAIHLAFIELLTETDYEKITITALAKKANIDRKTFYMHYSSIDKLFEDVIRQQTKRSLEGLMLSDLLNSPSRFVKKYLYAIQAAVPLSQDQRANLLGHIPMHKFMHYGTAIARERIFSTNENLSVEAKHYINVIVEFYLGGIFHAYALWLSGNTELTLDEVIELVSINVAEGLTGLMEQKILPLDYDKN